MFCSCIVVDPWYILLVPPAWRQGDLAGNRLALLSIGYAPISSLSLESLPCTLWQYGLWSFQTGDTKLDRFLPKNQHTQRKLLNFENWVNGEVSKSGHHFSK